MNTETRNIWIGVGVLVIVALGIIFIGKNKASAPDNVATENVIPSDWKAWESGTYNSATDSSTLYSVSYPKDFTLEKKGTAHGGFLQNPLATAAFPEGAFAEPKSTYNEAFATISSSKKKSTEALCFMAPAEATGEFVDVEAGSGTAMKRIDATGVGAGNIYTSRIYRTLSDGVCYEVALTVHTSNIGNFDPGTVVEFDKEQAFSVLEKIRQSFTVKQQAGPTK